MAYSSIGHMGFALVGLAAGTAEGTKSVLIYMAIYLVMTLGAFACIMAMRRAEMAVEEIDELAGLAQNNLPMAFCFAMLLFSLAGIPPLAGFFAKFYVFRAAVESGLWPLAILGVIASVIGAVYYLRIIKIMFFDEAVETFDVMSPRLKFVLGAAGAFILLYAVYPSPLVVAAEAAAKSIFPG
jgi:NADH-quinone oxidoreductase subunit N